MIVLTSINVGLFDFWAFLIAFAGVYLYNYYPTDIIIGIIVGLIIGNISKVLYYFIEKKRLKRIFKRNNILYQREKQLQKEQEEKINQEKENIDIKLGQNKEEKIVEKENEENKTEENVEQEENKEE